MTRPDDFSDHLPKIGMQTASAASTIGLHKSLKKQFTITVWGAWMARAIPCRDCPWSEMG
jgi:hypothetical protein